MYMAHMFPDARNAKKKPHGKKRKKSLPTESSKRRKLNDGSHVKVKPKHCTLQKIISSLTVNHVFNFDLINLGAKFQLKYYCSWCEVQIVHLPNQLPGVHAKT